MLQVFREICLVFFVQPASSCYEAQSHLPLSALLTCIDCGVVANNLGSLDGMQQICGHLPVATWQRVMRVMIDAYTPKSIYTLKLTVYMQYIYLYHKAGDNIILSHVQKHTHLQGWTQKHHVHHVGEPLVQNATLNEVSHAFLSHRAIIHPQKLGLWHKH